jgi:hypothetical protein
MAAVFLLLVSSSSLTQWNANLAYIEFSLIDAWGTVVYFVEALCYKPEGHWLNS